MICYTIGHSDRNLYNFIDIIKKYKIDCIMDIRSNELILDPENSFYLKHNLKEKLNIEGINWIDMENSFNIKSNDLQDIFSNYEFIKGINRLEEGIRRGHRIALLGKEYNPLHCNRGIVIGHYLKTKGITVSHILDKQLVLSQNHIEDLLIKKYKIKYKGVSNNQNEINYEELFNNKQRYTLNQKCL
ncbi:hypothetical protein [Clostridium sp. DL1XJH146]